MSQDYFKIYGLADKRVLEGAIQVSGAKNAALKVMASAALFKDHVALANVPEIEDVNRMDELLEGVGMKIEKSPNKRKIILPKELNPNLPFGPATAMRSSIVLTGPMLARMGKVSFPNPGGCSLGNRPIDMFLDGFRKMGAMVEEKGNEYVVTAKNGLKSMEFFFKVQSHTGTETLMMAATLAKGKTVLKNCALEPEVKSLADFLNSCGAKIKGAGTQTITVVGGKPLVSKSKVYKTLPDRIETGTFMILGALLGKKITVQKCIPEHVEVLIEILKSAGVKMDIKKDSISVYGAEKLKEVNVRTHEYPGLPTDLQAPMGVFLTQAEGESALFETVYENRLGYIHDLISMGAKITTQDTHRVLVTGKTPLSGKKVKAPDLRAGMAFVMAGLLATGETIVENAYVIDRGYEHIVERLTKLGAQIERGVVK